MAQTIGERIAALRKEKHITQTQLADYLFLVPQTVSKWEVGNGTPDISLLPQIADFFGISVDELFGRSSLDRTRDLVLKYSVLRDENSFREASECIRLQLQTIEASLKNQSAAGADLELQRKELESLEMHLLLQQSRESCQRALKITETLVERTGEMPFRLQRNQLHIMLGNRRFVLAECKKDFRETPCADTLQLYFEALINLERYEEILEIQRADSVVRGLMTPPSEHNVCIWTQCALAAVGTEDVEAAENYAGIVLKYGTKWNEYDLRRAMAELYKKKGLREKYEADKARLFLMLPELFENPYMAQSHQKALEQL